MVSPTAKPERKDAPHSPSSAYPAVSPMLGLYNTNSIALRDATILPRSKNVSFCAPSHTSLEAAAIKLNLPQPTQMQLSPRSRGSTTPLPADRGSRSRSRSSSPSASPPHMFPNPERIEHSGMRRNRSQSASPRRNGLKSKPRRRSRSRSGTPLHTDNPIMRTRIQNSSRPQPTSHPLVYPNTQRVELSGTRRGESRSASPRTVADDALKTAERKVHKCRGRTKSIAWFEMRSLTYWAKPPSTVDQLDELEDGDLLLNWLDSTRCQVWRFTQKQPEVAGQWCCLRWGAKCDQQDSHRFVVTEKGLPSFVAESTWKKKYKPQSPKIVV